MKDSTLFWRVFCRRSTLCFFVTALFFLSCILRVAATATSDYSKVAALQNTLKLTVGRQRGTIFDHNMTPLTNRSKKIIAAVSPTPRAITVISSILEGEEKTDALEQLKFGKPILCEVKEEINCDGIVCTEIFADVEEIPAVHLLGYTDRDSVGVCGINAAYNDILFDDTKVFFSYECDGKGNILNGVMPTVTNNSNAASNGVVTTLDINIQNITEELSKSIEVGAIVVAEAKTGKIRASVSMPTFQTDNVSDYLSSPDSPLLNRAINAYNVGSVFKPCVAIAGIENGLKGYSHICTGRSKIIDRYFNCHKYSGHGFMDLNHAIAHSCNTFFYNYAFKIGGKKIYQNANALRFGKSLKLCNEIYTSAGNLPTPKTLENIAHLANFSIGQGELLLSPVSMLPLYCAIASGGQYYLPSVVEGTLEDAEFFEYDIGRPTRVMSSDTADCLKNYLCSVISEGTGTTAQPKFTSAAGKTATAQTGKYQNNTEICEGWFCGFFPAEEPKYVVIVFSENTLRQTLSCSEVFANIADRITSLENR